jgi:putative ABC transport system permease protein
MKFKVLVFSALRNLNRNKTRSFLTMLGIIIGIASVIAIVALGEGYKNKTIKEFTGENNGEVVLQAMLSTDLKSSTDLPGNSFNNRDRNIVEDIKEVKKVEFMYQEVTFVSADLRGIQIQGLGKKVDEGENANIIGRNITKADNLNKKRVAVIGEQLLGENFKDLDSLVGSVATINGLTFEIIGIVKAPKEDEITFANFSGGIEIPTETYDKYISKGKNVIGLSITLNSETDVKETVKKIQDKLNKDGSNKSIGKYEVMDTSGIINILGGVLNTITMIIAAVAGISLFIAGIGVMNMVYTSVSERTLEIGIKRALGAKKKDIKREFLIEGIAITLTGGLIGYIFGLILAAVISSFMKMSIKPSLFTVSIAIITSILVGVLSSLLPAKKAANSNTVDILK